MNVHSRVTVFAALATFLGSLSLLPLFDNFGWIPPVVLAIAVVATASWLLQYVRALGAASPFILLLVLACLLTLLYAHGVAPLGFVPGPAAIRELHTALSSGFTDTTDLAAPAPVTRGLGLMATGGIGLVAIVMVTLAAAMRRPAVAGLPLLAIFTVPAAILSRGVGWEPFVFASVGYLALLLTEGEERVARWGRLVRPTRAHERPADLGTLPWADRSAGRRRGLVTAQLTQAGRRIGVLAIGAAIVVPVAIPGLHSGWFGSHRVANDSGLGSGSGSGSGPAINPIVSLKRDLQQTDPIQEFTYTTTGSPDYFRMLTLDTFDGTQWTASPARSSNATKIGNSIPSLSGVTVKPSGTVQTAVKITALPEHYLPLPFQPTSVKAHGNWLYDQVTGVVYSSSSTTRGLSYQVQSALVQPSPTALNGIDEAPGGAAVAAYLQVPAGLPPLITTTAAAVVNAAHATTPYEIAVALQDWFLRNFTYNLNAGLGSSTHALVSFLENKQGYCEQFAATMALMARIEGIPARVAVGFTAGTAIPGTKSYQVTTADAHAWPELYFPGAGWLRFEPTPRADGQAVTPGYTVGTPSATPSSSVPISGGAVAPNRDQAPHGLGQQPLGAATRSPSFGSRITGLPWGRVLTLVILAAVLVAPATLRWRMRRRRRTAGGSSADVAHAAWLELGDDLRDLGFAWDGLVDTPRRAAAGLLATGRLRHAHAAQQALAQLAHAEELARYAGVREQHAIDASGLFGAEDVLRHALGAAVSRPRRLRARLWPMSVSGYWLDVRATVEGAWRRPLRLLGVGRAVGSERPQS